MTPTSKLTATVTLPSDTEILITRVFNAPPALVFKAMNEPEYVRRWYGCGMMTMTVCDIDLRVGGTWRYVLQEPSGREHAFSGEFAELDAPSRWVVTERYEPIEGSEHVCRLTLTEQNGKSFFQNHMSYPNKMARDGHLMSGMEQGMNQSLQHLDDVLEDAQRLAA